MEGTNCPGSLLVLHPWIPLCRPFEDEFYCIPTYPDVKACLLPTKLYLPDKFSIEFIRIGG